MSEDLLTTEEVCQELGISHPTLWRYRKNDADFPLPIRLSARKHKYRKNEISDYKYLKQHGEKPLAGSVKD